MFPLWSLIKTLLPMIGLLVLIVVVKVIIEEIYYRYFYEKDTNENNTGHCYRCQ
jgi:hypothetical protein